MRKYLAEFLAAFFLVFAGVGAIVADQQLAVVFVRDSFGPLGIALAHGLALAVAIAAIGRISGGHANPAVSLAFFIARRISSKDLAGYIGAQLLGGVAGAFFVSRLFPAVAVSDSGLGTPKLADGLSTFQGAGIEVILTFLLAFVIWGVAVDAKGPKALAPFAIGLTVTFEVLVGAVFTGAAMNPARWFGPALVSGEFGNWWVWIVGPIVGALLASLLYESFFLVDPAEAGDGTGDDAAIKVEELEAGDADWRDTPSPMTPPSGEPKPSGEDSPMTPPPPESAPEPMPAPDARPVLAPETPPESEAQKAESPGESVSAPPPVPPAPPATPPLPPPPPGA